MKKINSLLIVLFLSTVSIAQKNHVLGEVIAKVESNDLEAYLSFMNANYSELNVLLKEVISKDAELYLFQYDYVNRAIQEEEVLHVFRSFPSCQFAQWNHNNIEYRKAPDDPSFPVQWNLKNVDAEKAWSIATGGITKDSQEIVIAVIDESFLLNHDDLKANVWVNRHEIPNNNVDDDKNGYVDDVSGWNTFDDSSYIYPAGSSHGTMVAGMLGAKTNNTTDVASLNWDVKFVAVQGSSTLESVALKSYDYVLDLRKMYNRSNGDSGAYIIVSNSSFGVNRGKPQNFPAWCEMYNIMGRAGIISVGAGPNSNEDVDAVGDIPTTCPSNYLIAVTSIDRNDKKAVNSGFGKVSIDLGAPGVDVISTDKGNGVSFGSGTSYATPMVSSALALMYSALPKDTLVKYKNDQDKLALLVRGLMLKKGTRKISSMDGTTTGGTLNLYQCILAAIDSSDTTVRVSPIQHSPYALTVYPNPFHEVINLEVSGNENIDWSMEIIDLTGTVVLSGSIGNVNSQSIKLNNLSDGIYLLKVYVGEHEMFVKRLIKN
tara:strand:- start:6040 stop:7671 length:1632 start_codon:yes stop_codon:yes gene_type:complete